MSLRSGSPLAVVHALALTTATLLTGAWDLSGHGHDPVAANASRCVADHEGEAAGILGDAMLAQAAAPHEHSCVACQFGRTKTVEDRKSSTASPLDLSFTASGSDHGPGSSRGERWRQPARGPPLA